MKILTHIFTFVFTLFLFFSCDDWTEMEQARHTDLVNGGKSDEYYANLRAYKKSDHPIAFGWFGGWTGADASMKTSLRGLPDSVDMVSIWGGWQNLTPAKKADLKYVQEVKGTKVLMCYIVANLGDQLTPRAVRDNWEANGFASEKEAVNAFWGWTDGTIEGLKKSIVVYANAICDTIMKYGYDGFDLDLEPNYGAAGNIATYPDRLSIMLRTMRERLGMRSETGKILAVDGEPTWLEEEMGAFMDYYIYQAYGTTRENNLHGKVGGVLNKFGNVVGDKVTLAKRVIVTENFEASWKTGGVDFQDRFGNTMKSLEGMARWTPIVNGVEYPKGGVGTYHMEHEYTIPGEEGTYPFLRNAIRIMNPPIQ